MAEGCKVANLSNGILYMLYYCKGWQPLYKTFIQIGPLKNKYLPCHSFSN